MNRDAFSAQRRRAATSTNHQVLFEGVIVGADALDEIANEGWRRRVKQFNKDAASDHAMYAWLEQAGKLPLAGCDVPAALRDQWRAMCREKCQHETHSSKPARQRANARNRAAH